VDLESVKGEIERVVVTDEKLQARLKEIAAQIEADYKNQDTLLSLGCLAAFCPTAHPLARVDSYACR
jgi:hypoxanthine-guanine phosphoribosyltransferase